MQLFELQNTQYRQESHRAMDSVFDQLPLIHQQTEKMIHCLEKGGKVLWLGNGGSAADAQHLAAELMVRFVKNRRPLASIALTTDTSILTAHSNDYEFDTVFARQIEALAGNNDFVIGMSTSGNSPNVVKAIEKAKEKGSHIWAWTGEKDSRLSTLDPQVLKVSATATARIQEGHILAGHLICDILDAHFA